MTPEASAALLTYGPLGIGWIIAVLAITWLVKSLLAAHVRELDALERMTKEASAIANAATAAQMAQSATIERLTQSVKDMAATLANQAQLVASLTQSIQMLAMARGRTPEPFAAVRKRDEPEGK